MIDALGFSGEPCAAAAPSAAAGEDCDDGEARRHASETAAPVTSFEVTGQTTLHIRRQWSSMSDMLQALPSQVDPELLRGLTVTEALTGFGKHWQSNSSTAEDFALSQSMSTIDDFLSHDWGTPAWRKFLALCTLYNRPLAFMVSCGLAVPLALIGARTRMTIIRGHVATLVCPLVYLFVLLFGQRLRGLLACKKPRYVFLDKLCICQTDEEKKSAGILGLAGFLKASRRLVVLWSPRYFSRLWCTYEVVTWIHLQGLDAGNVLFLPSAACIIQGQVIIAVSTYKVLKVMFLEEVLGFNDWASTDTAGFVITMVMFLLILPVFYTITSLVAELKLVEDQVKDFRIRDSKCFCCTHDHIHPNSGLRLACDRKLVYTTLQKWHEESLHADCERSSQFACKREADLAARRLPVGCSSSDAALDDFDAAVRSGLSRLFSQALAFYGFSYHDCVCSCLSSIWSGCDEAALHIADGRYMQAVRWLFEYSTLPLFVFPLAFTFGANSFVWMDRALRCINTGRWRNVVPAFFAAFVLLGAFIVLWLPGPLLVANNNREALGVLDLLIAVRYIGLATLAYRVMRSSPASTGHTLSAGGTDGELEAEEAACPAARLSKASDCHICNIDGQRDSACQHAVNGQEHAASNGAVVYSGEASRGNACGTDQSTFTAELSDLSDDSTASL
eukprot:TRINITY_DN91533_c0_g1_i1.p1 TRINITY_DN91533_c0_g1~~TRINITY_DN91533_c0_g1_i1.p1  ORF type:complete len:675 (+),score=74.18 TRINITY_DN91533_c0_g1_i1:83-2107(+)